MSRSRRQRDSNYASRGRPLKRAVERKFWLGGSVDAVISAQFPQMALRGFSLPHELRVSALWAVLRARMEEGTR